MVTPRRIIKKGAGQFHEATAQTHSIDPAAMLADRAYELRLNQIQKGPEIYPLDAPGLPLLPNNSAFLITAESLGDDVSKLVEVTELDSNDKKIKVKKLDHGPILYDLIRSAIRVKDFSMMVEVGPHRVKEATFVPGHIWSESTEAVSGPRPADVMIINKMVWLDELQAGRCFSGDDGALLVTTLQTLKAANLDRWYVTNLIKFMPPGGKTTLKQVWIKDAMFLLMQEIRIVQPKYILCLGADVSKALLGTHATVTAMEGRVATIEYTSAFDIGDTQNRKHVAQVMTVVHPRQVLRDQALERQLEKGLGRFVSLTQGREVGVAETVSHTAIDNYNDLVSKLVEIEHDPGKLDSVVAVDAEWHGEHPVNDGSYIRTIQLAWRPHHAIGIKVHEAGGDPAPGFPDRGKLNELLYAYFNGGKVAVEGRDEPLVFSRKRVVGHFFNSDLEWLIHFGLDLRDVARCPVKSFDMSPNRERKGRNRKLYRTYVAEGFEGTDVPAWYRTKHEGGADTGLMAHAVEEAAQYKLEVLAMRYTSAPRYDSDLLDWRTTYCKANGLTSKNMEGYGECPDSILLPYGMYDADVTLRLFYVYDVLLDEDYEKNCCREAFWESQISAPAALEISTAGITIDKARADFLTNAFIKARGKMETKLRDTIKWPDFNVRSTQHVKELLFGHHLNGKLDKETGNQVRIRPDGAVSLCLAPIFDTSKPQKLWSDIERMRRQSDHSPSTNKQSLALLAQAAQGYKADIVNFVRDYRFVDQVLKSVLRPPSLDGDTEEVIFDDDGYQEYEEGLVASCCDDGKVRTHIYQVKETGRWSSARPPLQNISKRRDADYKRLLGDDYKYVLRSMMRASPGTVLIEADFVGAELFGMAVMAGDENMIAHALRNQLPEDHPDYYDIHSNVAVAAFHLTCPPTKSGLKAIGRGPIRIVAKSVIFGIAYGRGAKAIAVAAKEEGINITVDEAQQVIDAIFAMYPRLRPFFDECKARATGKFIDPNTGEQITDRFVCSCFGRFRRFPKAKDQSMEADFERQAMNFPIQSMIASVVSRAIAALQIYRDAQIAKGHGSIFTILLQIHDAILFEVPYRYVRFFCEKVLPRYMRETVPIYPSTLDGLPTGKGPYLLGIEAEVMEHWGESLSHARASELQLPTGHGGATGCVVNYSKARLATVPRLATRSNSLIRKDKIHR